MTQTRATAFCVLASGLLLGTTYSHLKISELYSQADLVVLVQIVEGRTLGDIEEPCGALYVGRVIEMFKGLVVSSVTFGHSPWLEIGSEYLLFLSKPGRLHRAIETTNSAMEAAGAASLSRCQPLQTGWNIIHSGFGAIKLHWAPELDFERAFAIHIGYVSFPNDVATKDADLGTLYQLDTKWVRREDALRALRKLKE